MTPCLKKIRRKRYPRCCNLKDLHFLMKRNKLVNNTFGRFREEKFYCGLVGAGNNAASIFCLKQFLNKMPKSTKLFIDATFKVTPIFSSQLLVIMADIDGQGSV